MYKGIAQREDEWEGRRYGGWSESFSGTKGHSCSRTPTTPSSSFTCMSRLSTTYESEERCKTCGPNYVPKTLSISNNDSGYYYDPCMLDWMMNKAKERRGSWPCVFFMFIFKFMYSKDHHACIGMLNKRGKELLSYYGLQVWRMSELVWYKDVYEMNAASEIIKGRIVWNYKGTNCVKF